jgi:hypothetical protein
MERYQFRPEVKYNINPKLSARASYSYYIVNHIKDEGKDGHANETFISLDYALPENLGSLYGGLGFDVLSADSPDQDYDRFKLTAGISIKAPYKVLASLVGEYNNKEYDNIDSFYDVKRSDDKYFASISFSRKILYNWLSISLEYNYTKNNSNISDFEYRKNVGILSLTANL